MSVEANPVILSSECAVGVEDEHMRCQELRTRGWSANERCECNCHDLSPVTLVSFGYGHRASSTDTASIDGATIVIDVRRHFSDPHVNPALRKLHGFDAEVRAAVMTTPGVEELVQALIGMIYAFRSGPVPGPVKIAIGCVGGRHRSVAIALEVCDRLWTTDHRVSVGIRHRDIDKPLLPRRASKSA
jgi:RNase adaptor protein for sRNA GlmZ degradation